MKDSKCSRLSAVALGVAFGVTCGLGMLIMVWAAWLGGIDAQMIEKWANFYPGVAATLIGGLVAGGWGFLKGFVFGAVVGWVYNFCLCCCPHYRCCDKSAACDAGPCGDGDKK